MRQRGPEGSAKHLAVKASHKSVGRVERASLRTPIKKRRSKPRRGRVVDKDYLAWIHTKPCAVVGPFIETGRKGVSVRFCMTPVTAHHVRRFGEPKNDRRTIPLCWSHHFHSAGPYSIERLGKAGFEKFYDIDIEATILKLNQQYQEETNGSHKIRA